MSENFVWSLELITLLVIAGGVAAKLTLWFKRKRHTTNIVCLCGSTKFKQAFETAVREESLKGNIVLSVAMFGHLEGLDMNGPEKRIFDELHLRKIDLCDEVFVLNVGGYIGEGCKREIEYATSLKRPIRYLEPKVTK